MPDFIPKIQMEWLVISGAPWSFLAAIATVGSVIWALIWLIHRGEIAGKNSTIEALNERLNLAADKSEVAGKVEDELKKKIEILETAIAAKADNESLIKLTAEVKEGFAKVSAANNAVSSAVSMTLKANDAVETASFTIDTTKLEALRDIDGLGALRKLDPETLNKIKDVGKPFGRGMIDPKQLGKPFGRGMIDPKQ